MRRLADLAGRQFGAVSRGQLLALGFSVAWIDHALRAGRLTQMHRGVYFAGHGPITLKTRAMAATLACGPDALVSHRTAACLYHLLPYPANNVLVDVTVPRHFNQRTDIRLHRSTRLAPPDRRTLDGIPITSPARTLLDIAAAAPHELDRSFDEAIFRRVVRLPQLRELMSRSTGRRGTPALRSLVTAEETGERNRLEAERRFRALIADAKLPKPLVNAPVGRFVVDFLWPGHRVVAELDGFATHGRRAAFESDRARDGDLQALGYRVIRVTWRQLTREPQAVVARVAAVLALSGRELARG